MENLVKVRRALISVADKRDLRNFVGQLKALEMDIVSTGDSAQVIRDAGVPVTDVAEVTGFLEMMDGRLKMIHPLIAGGMLMRPDNPRDVEEASLHGIVAIQLVVVNLYDFASVASDQYASMNGLIAKIDIGGPTIIRAAAKNWQYVAVITSPQQYADVLEHLRKKRRLRYVQSSVQSHERSL